MCMKKHDQLLVEELKNGKRKKTLKAFTKSILPICFFRKQLVCLPKKNVRTWYMMFSANLEYPKRFR